MGALRYKKTKTDNTVWDSSKAVPNAESAADAYAYFDDERNSYKLPHHFVDENGVPGAASVKACQAAISYLNSQGKKDGMSDEDIAGAHAHLAAHLRDAGEQAQQLNSVPAEGSHIERITLAENSFEDDGDGRLTFPGGQVIMDGNELRSGMRYEMETLDPSEFNGSVTEDHDRRIRSIVAKTKMYKRGDELVIDYLQFAIRENPIAQVDYDLYRNGYARDMSIETYGPWADEEGVWKKAKVVGHSLVVVGNSKSARVNSEVQQLVANSLATAKGNNLDVAELEEKLGVKAAAPEPTPPKPAEPAEPEPKPAEPKAPPTPTSNNNNEEVDMKYKTVKNSQPFAVAVKYKNADGEEAEQALAPGATIDVAEDQAEAVEAQVKNATDPANKPMTKEDIGTVVNAALEEREKKHAEEMEAFKNSLIDQSAKVPEWRPRAGARNSAGTASKKLEDMDYKERTTLQLQSLAASVKGRDSKASTVLQEINRINLEAQQADGLVDNALDLSDLGNFVIPREMITEIKELPSNYTPLLDRFRFEETASLQTAWLKTTGELRMADVDMNQPSSGDADLKPISTPTFDDENVNLTEFAAITPVKSSSIRFNAVDVMGQITKMYRRAYARALAESVIGRLQLALDSNGNTVPFDYSSAAGGDIEAIITLITAWGAVSEQSPNGLYLLTQNSRSVLWASALRSGPNGPLAGLFSNRPDGTPQFLDQDYIVVPSTLMPNLNSGNTKSWTFEGESVTVDTGIFYADPDNFVGKVSGGLNFQVSDTAAYEENGTVKSAYQRDELVFRGYGFRASGLSFEENVSGVSAPGIS